jgi:hypothetical protein
MSAMTEGVRVRIVVDDSSEARDVESVLEESGASHIHTSGEGFENKGIVPILIIVGAIAGVAAVADLVMRIRAKTQCQEVIDARQAEIKVTKNCDFRDGRIVVISADSQKVEIHDVPDGLDVTKVLEAALKGGADAVKAAAEAAGAKASDPKPADA